MEDVVNLMLGDLDFDPDALKAKYLEERDKRLRDDANDQYIEVTGDFSNYVDDPYAKAGLFGSVTLTHWNRVIG